MMKLGRKSEEPEEEPRSYKMKLANFSRKGNKIGLAIFDIISVC